MRDLRLKLECKDSGNPHDVFAALMAVYYTDIPVNELLDKLNDNPLYKGLSGLNDALQTLERLDAKLKNYLIHELELAGDGYYVKLKEPVPK